MREDIAAVNRHSVVYARRNEHRDLHLHAVGDYQLRLLGIDPGGKSTDLGLYPFQITKN